MVDRQHSTPKPLAWPHERTLSLSAEPSLLGGLAAAVPEDAFSAPACGHAGAPFCASRHCPGGPSAEIVCSTCYDAQLGAWEVSNLQAQPVVPGAQCMECSTTHSVVVTDLIPMCKKCRGVRFALGRADDLAYKPKLEEPCEVLKSRLYIGSKDAAGDLATLQRLGIRRVLICCTALPPYHSPATSGLRYHRLAIQDSLEENLKHFLPSAFAFIAHGILRGEATLVHCNAGVSRSGSVVVSFLSAAVPLAVEEAYAAALGGRPAINPNSNFLKQLGYEPSAATLAAAEAAAAAAAAQSGGAQGEGKAMCALCKEFVALSVHIECPTHSGVRGDGKHCYKCFWEQAGPELQERKRAFQAAGNWPPRKPAAGGGTAAAGAGAGAGGAQ